ncbi:MAG: tetratricopeptide repeat protein [Gammaproteobacteria bacterium]|jgi:tetratricopeptide (TPR) repeat protein|nr:tetratricopeptide repeat protein [Gammaproteobacteria bacterium]
MLNTSLRSIFFILVLGFSLGATNTFAQSNRDEPSVGGNSSKAGKTRTYKKARVLQNSTAKKIVKVVEALERQKIVKVPDPENKGKFIEKEEDDPDWAEAKRILTELLNNRAELKSYDRSVMWNYWGYLYFSDEDYDQAMYAYEQLLKEPDATVPLRTASLLTLAQLNLVKENWDKGIRLILQWMDEVENVTAQSYYLLSSAYFQKEDFVKARSNMETAIRLAEEEGYRPKENWYVLLAACFSELKDRKIIGAAYALEQQLGIYEILVNYYPKKMYFLQLAGTYQQMDREEDYMITLKAAHGKDLLDKEGEYLALAQLLLIKKNPYWAAQVLVSGQQKKVTIKDEDTGEEEVIPVLKDTEKNLKLLADSWRMAQEIDKAIPVLEKAAKMSKDGDTYVLLGNLYLFEDRMKDSIRAIEAGLKKAKVKSRSQAQLVLGQAHFELQNFEEAKKQFRLAARDDNKRIKKTANSWIKYAENEEIRVKNLALRRDFIQQSKAKTKAKNS